MTAGNTGHLPFERPLAELKQRIEELQRNTENNQGLSENLNRMEDMYQQLARQLYEDLSAWNTVELARHPQRPQARDYIDMIVDDFQELHGDRQYRDDLAIVTGLGMIDGRRVMIVGQHKGRDVNERHVCNAGCPHPEGYWKALRKMRIAEKFGLPVICFIDTKGAYPGIGSEERGVAIAIAENMREMSVLRVPVICAVIGEGGSGGALGIGVGDRVIMMQHAYFSVISPEGCASILWRDGEKKAQAAAVLKLTSRDLKGFGLIDEIVEEPLGGANKNRDAAADFLKQSLVRNLDELAGIPVEDLLEQRYRKYRAFGEFLEGQVLPEEQEVAAG